MDKNNGRNIGITFAIILLLNGLLSLIGIYNRTKPPADVIVKEFEQEVTVASTDTNVLENRLIIPTINVNLELGEDEEYLDFGGWVQNLNTNELPLVISAHRFGIDYLDKDWDVTKTLFSITQAELGDSVEVHWNGEKHVYEISEMYRGDNNKPIKDEDILLYTCEYWDSEERVFAVLKPKDS